MRKVTVWRMRERYAQTVFTFRIIYVHALEEGACLGQNIPCVNDLVHIDSNVYLWRDTNTCYLLRVLQSEPKDPVRLVKKVCRNVVEVGESYMSMYFAILHSYVRNVEHNFTFWTQKGKAIPLQAWTGPEGSRRLRLPDFKTFGTYRW